MPEVLKLKLLRQIIVGLVCLLFLVSPVFSFAATTQLELQMTPFPAPTNLTAIVISSSQIDLNWSPVSIAVSYKVYRNGVLIASPTTTSYSDTGLTRGNIYSYTVSAVNANEAESPQSSPFSVTIPIIGGGILSQWLMPPQPPIGGFWILINNGVLETNSREVTLTLNGGSDTTRMAISNFSDFRDAVQEPYQTTKTWVLTAGEGLRTVYVKFYTSWGRSSEVVSDAISLVVPPTLLPLSPEAKKVDANNDGRIDILDFNILITNWGATVLGNVADFNEDSIVDIFDFNLLMVYWSM